MLSDAAAMLAIFVLVPLLAAFFAMRSYRRLVRREREERAEQPAAKAGAPAAKADNIKPL